MLVNIINKTIVVLVSATFVVALLINNKLTINIAYILSVTSLAQNNVIC